MNKVKYVSKIDSEKRIFFRISMAIMLSAFLILLCIALWQNPVDYGLLIFSINILILTSISRYLFYNCYYTFEEGKVVCYLGTFDVRAVHITQVKSIDTKYIKFGIYGNSRDLISLVLKDGSRMNISPLDKKGFIQEIMRWNPDITLSKGLEKFLQKHKS